MTTFTGWDLVVRANRDPGALEPPSLTAPYYCFLDSSGAGYFLLNGVVQPQGVEIDLPAYEVQSLSFVQADPIDDYVDVADNVSIFDPMLLDPAATPLANEPPPPPQALPPVISFDSGSYEINAIAGTATYTLTRSFIPIGDIGSAVDVSTVDGTAVAPTDYTAKTEHIEFRPGQTTQTFTVQIKPDAAFQAANINPDFGLVLSNPVHATIGLGTAETTIIENPPPIVTVASTTATLRPETVFATTMISAVDPGGRAITEYDIWDSGTGGTQLKLNGAVEPAQTEVILTPSQFASLMYTYGATNTQDRLWARAFDGFNWSAWANGTEKGFVDNGPVVTPNAANFAATHNQSFAANSFFTARDSDGDAVTQYGFWDTGGGGGHFLLNGVAQATNAEFDIPVSQLAQVTYQAGSGTDTLWVRANDGTVWGAWSHSFTVTVPQPTLSVTSNTVATKGQMITLSSLVTVSDPGLLGYKDLQLWDSHGTVAGGEFTINNVAQGANQAITVARSDFANTFFDAPMQGGIDTMWARLIQNDGSATAWQRFTVTVAMPTLSVASISSATAGQPISLSSLVTINDPATVGYRDLQLWDSDGTVAGGEFKINNAAQAANQVINVAPGNFLSTEFDAPTQGGTDTLWARLLQNDGSVTAWQRFTVTVATPTLSVTSVANATKGQLIPLSNLATVLDPGFVGYQDLQLWDSDGTVAGGEFTINGMAQPANQPINVTPANFTNTVFDAGTQGGTDTLWARLVQDNGAATAWQRFTVTVPQPTLTVHNVTTATPGQVIPLSSFVTISDPSGVGFQKLELWDSDGTAATGQFVISGAPQSGGHEIDVSPSTLAMRGNPVVFDEGTTGNTDTLWARLQQNDGTLTPWQRFTVTDPLTVEAGATLELDTPYAGTVDFAGASGTLQLDNSASFSGTVAGMFAQDTLDLRDIAFVAPLLPSYSPGASSGTLSVSDGIHSASIALLGDYTGSSFVASSDGHGGTSIVVAPRVT